MKNEPKGAHKRIKVHSYLELICVVTHRAKPRFKDLSRFDHLILLIISERSVIQRLISLHCKKIKSKFLECSNSVPSKTFAQIY